MNVLSEIDAMLSSASIELLPAEIKSVLWVVSNLDEICTPEYAFPDKLETLTTMASIAEFRMPA